MIFSGVPGTGKSSLAEHAARQLGAVLLSKDIIEAALWRSEVGSAQNSGWAAYEVMTALAAEQLRLGRSVVLDSVAKTKTIRATWLAVAAEHGATIRVIHCILSDRAQHRARMEGRQRGIPGWPEVSWDDLERISADFEPWPEEHLLLDAARPTAENVASLAKYLADPAKQTLGHERAR